MSNKIKILSKVVTTNLTYPNVMHVIGISEDTVTCFDPSTNEEEFFDKSELIVVGSEIKPQSKYDYLKAYILIKDTAPIGLGINAASHCGFLLNKLNGCDNFKEWEKNSFRKVTCLVTNEQFEEAMAMTNPCDRIVFVENDWDGHETEPMGVVFAPKYSFPDFFRSFKLHSGKHL